MLVVAIYMLLTWIKNYCLFDKVKERKKMTFAWLVRCNLRFTKTLISYMLLLLTSNVKLVFL